MIFVITIGGFAQLPDLTPGTSLLAVAAMFAAVLGSFIISWSVSAYGGTVLGWKGSIAWPLFGVAFVGNLVQFGLRTLALAVAGVLLILGLFLLTRRLRELLRKLQERTLMAPENLIRTDRLGLIDTLLGPYPQRLGDHLFQQPWPWALLYGGVAGCLSALFLTETVAMLHLVFVGPLLALLRFAFGVGRLQSPLGLLARWKTGRWVIPGYDLALLPSLYLVGITFGFGAIAWFLPPAFQADFCGLGIALAVAIACGTGHDYHEWVLTAPGRFSIEAPQQRSQRSFRLDTSAL